MFWKKGDSAITLEQADLQVMKLCKMPMEELLRQRSVACDIPPLWSVLSYSMLVGGCSAGSILRDYRQVREMAKNTAPFYERRPIPKANGGVRWLYVPRYTLRERQQHIAWYVLCELPVDSHAYAYRPGVSFRECAQPHVGKDVLIHLDLQNFFGSIKEDMVFSALLRDTGYAPSLCRFFAKLCCLHGSLPQGTVTSPALSNIVFRSCDEALAKLAEDFGMNYSRYSDDLYFSGNGQVDAGEVIGQVSQLLNQYGFRLNPEKTQVRRQQHRQSVLGLTVNEGIRVSRSYRRQLEKELYFQERFGENCSGARNAESYLLYLQQLLGKVSYVLQIDPENQKFAQFRHRLQNCISRQEYLQKQSWLRAEKLEEKIRLINAQYGLEISLDAIREVYGREIVAKLAESEVDTLANIHCLIEMGFGDAVSDICNRYGILLCDDNGYFRYQVRQLASAFESDYIKALTTDLSLWESIL